MRSSPTFSLLCGAVASAGGIESQNVVGYQEMGVESGKFTILAAQFQDTATGEIDLNKILTGVAGVDWDEDGAYMTTAPQIQVQTASGYTTFYYLNDGYVNDDTTMMGWCNNAGDYADLKLSAGSSFWFRDSGESPSATVAGQVEDGDVVSVKVSGGAFTLIGNAFPSALSLNSAKFTSDDIAGVDWDEDGAYMTTAPQIQVQTASGYTTFYYLNDGYVNDDTTRKGWCNNAGDYVSDADIAAGRGFWFKAASDTTFKFTK